MLAFSRMASQMLLLQCTIMFIGLIYSSQPIDELLYEQFEKFAVHYKKEYLSNSTEFIFRFKIFKDNIAHSRYLNKAHNSSHQPVYGLNKFSDLTPKEFRARYLMSLKRNGCVRTKFSAGITHKDFASLGIPQKFDWREKGVVNPVRDQGSCGACWAFSVVETMESMYAIQYSSNYSVPELSVQQLIDCDDSSNGCQGGDICGASKWASVHGVVNESMYPLTDRTDRCRTLPVSLPHVYVKNYSCDSFRGKEMEMLKLLAEHGPVAVAVDATTWHNYVGGIIQFHCSANINHAVQIVGYDLTGDVPYYIIRNSWGADFGDHGYVYVKYGENLCGLAEEVSQLDVTGYR